MRPLLAGLLACAWLLAARDAAAQAPTPNDLRAHQAYERGSAAYRRGDYGTAAREYAAADALAPNPTALQAALDAAVQADDPVLGEQLLDRARSNPRSNGLTATVLVAARKFAGRTGRIAFHCADPRCNATVDGAEVDPGEPAIVRVGAHTVTLDDRGPAQRSVDVTPDGTVTIGAPAAPPPATVAAPQPTPALPESVPVQPRPASSGLSPAWFFAGLGASAVAGGLAIGFGVDTADKHTAFDRDCHTSHPASDCASLASSGESAQIRTNAALVATGVLAAGTAVTALFVRWHARARVGVGLGGVWMSATF